MYLYKVQPMKNDLFNSVQLAITNRMTENMCFYYFYIKPCVWLKSPVYSLQLRLI